MISESSSLSDVCFAVAGALATRNIAAVLCGGSAATIYAPRSYLSYDADFVLDNDDPLDDVAHALISIDFKREGKSRIFVHPTCRFTVDFPKGPLGVGNDYVHSVATLTRGSTTLRIVTRTDCVRDRLAHFYYWDDLGALDAAVAVTMGDPHDVDLALIRAWTEREDPKLLSKFDEFEQRLQAR